MVVIYDEIRFDPTRKSVDACDGDWAINPKHHTMQHEPTRTVFLIELDEKPTEGDPLTPMDFSARLVAIKEGCALPPPEIVEMLGRAALALYLVAIGLIEPNASSEAILPDGVQQAYAC